jgi:peptidyl-prolyl cis-trans isomerase C
VVTEADLAGLYDTDALPVDQDLRFAVFNLIARVILVDAMTDEFGISLDEDAVETLYQEMLAEMEQSGITPEQALGVRNAGFGMVRFNAELMVIRDTVTDLILSDPEFLDRLFEEAVGVTTVCAQHILVDTFEEAIDVAQSLDEGEDFAALAAEASRDTAPGGDLGCRLADEYVPEFARATIEIAVGEVSEPVETQFGWHVIIVSERTVFDRAQVESDPRSYVSSIQANQMWSAWVNARLAAAEVDLAERYGTWTPAGITPSG